MTVRYFAATVIFFLLGCAQKNSDENNAGSVESPKDSLAVAPKAEPEAKQSAELPLTDVNLKAFSFSTPYAAELIFLDSGKVRLPILAGEPPVTGHYFLAERTIKVAVAADTAIYEVQSFTEDALTLVASDKMSAKIFGEVLRDADGKASIDLYRIIFAAPYPEDVISGGWSDAFGGTNFESEGSWVHTEPDCVARGTWAFDGENLVMKVTEKTCDVAYAPGNFKVLKLARRLLVLQKDDGKIESWTRPGI